MMHFLTSILAWIIGLVGLLIASLLLNFILMILKIGNIKTVLFVRKVEILLSRLPSELLLAATSAKVAALTFDSTQNKEQATPLYTGVVTWSGAPRPVSQVRAMAKRQFAVRAAIFGFVFVPLIAACCWLTLFVSWGFVIAIPILIFHQAYPFYLWAYPGFSELLHDV
jgi:hypothetical protein